MASKTTAAASGPNWVELGNLIENDTCRHCCRPGALPRSVYRQYSRSYHILYIYFALHLERSAWYSNYLCCSCSHLYLLEAFRSEFVYFSSPLSVFAQKCMIDSYLRRRCLFCILPFRRFQNHREACKGPEGAGYFASMAQIITDLRILDLPLHELCHEG